MHEFSFVEKNLHDHEIKTYLSLQTTESGANVLKIKAVNDPEMRPGEWFTGFNRWKKWVEPWCHIT